MRTSRQQLYGSTIGQIPDSEASQNNMMHSLVRDLYKRALVVGRDYPLGLEYVRRTWKTALRNQRNCPSCYLDNPASDPIACLDAPGCEKELRKAVARGRFMVREMIGVIQLKKYRTMKRRYDIDNTNTTKKYIPLLASQPERKSDS